MTADVKKVATKSGNSYHEEGNGQFASKSEAEGAIEEPESKTDLKASEEEGIINQREIGRQIKRRRKRSFTAHEISEIDRWYHTRFSNRIGKRCWISIGNFFYIFQNHGFNSYELEWYFPIDGNEAMTNVLRRIVEES